MQTANLRHASFLAAAAIVGLVLPAHAQTRALTTDDYARAEKFLGYNTNGLVLHVAAQPTWVGDERFWYRTTTENGTEFFLVDAATGARTAAFDQAKIAAALSTAGRATTPRIAFRSTSSTSVATASPSRSTRAEASGRVTSPARAVKVRSSERSRRRSCRLMANALRSSGATTSGCATRPRARKRS